MKLAVVGTGKIVREVLPHLAGWSWDVAAICATPRSAEKGRAFARQMGTGDLEACYGALEQSPRVSGMLTRARQSAGIRFPED